MNIRAVRLGGKLKEKQWNISGPLRQVCHNPPLLYAINIRDNDAVRFLLANGADPTNNGNIEYTPLELALLQYHQTNADEIAQAIADKLNVVDD